MAELSIYNGVQLQAAYERQERQLSQQAQQHLPLLESASGVKFASPRFSEFGQYLSLAPSPQGSRLPGPAGSHASNGRDDGGHHSQQQPVLPTVLEEQYQAAMARSPRSGLRTAGGLPLGFSNGGFDALASTPRRMAAVQQAADSLSVGGPYARMHSETEAAAHHAPAGAMAGGGYHLPQTPPPAYDAATAQREQLHPEHCWQPPWVSAGLTAQDQMQASFSGPKPVRPACRPSARIALSRCWSTSHCDTSVTKAHFLPKNDGQQASHISTLSFVSMLTP